MTLRSAAFLVLALILALFLFAAFVEARREYMDRLVHLRRRTYTIALGVFCTSWTFYGAAGSAVREGWNYLPIYVAPILTLILAPRFLSRLGRAVADEQATTVSDFIAARFSHDPVVARLVTITALLGSIPYVALQLRSIGSAISIVSGREVAAPVMAVAAILLALFAALYGARRFELAGRSEGLLYAIGFDSLLKLAAMVAVAVLATVILMAEAPDRLSVGLDLIGQRFRPEHLSLDTGVIALISALAIIALPRQFYMGLVEARDPDDLANARWGLALYLVAMAALVLPIALAGLTVLPAGIAPDLYMLQLPAFAGNRVIVATALLGGVSAAASMAIVDTTALATMVSNDLVFPSVLRSDTATESGAIGRRMLIVRRLSILGVMLLALSWALLVSPTQSLASIGLIAFAAMAQFTPHLVLAANGGGRDPVSARASLSVGLALWLYTLALPPILPPGWLAMLADSPFNPLRLFGIGSASPLVHGVMWSLSANLAVQALLAARKLKSPALPRILRSQRQVTDLNELVQLTASFIGKERAAAEFPDAQQGLAIDRRSAQRAQELIARVVGTSSARLLVTSALAGGTMSLPEVTQLLDEGGQSLRFSRQLLAATFENIDAGISVVDAELNLIAWNSRYLEIFDYPPGLVRVGTPVADLIRHNAQSGDFGAGDTEYHIEKRLRHMRRGQAHSFERHRRDGRVIKTVGGPMPGGGYVMSFTDITQDARVREELHRTLNNLEGRVIARTRELSEANRRLARTDREKTRFLAAASHDLLQPLHAARLFSAALARDLPPNSQPVLGRVEQSIIAAENLLRALLDISQLDAGGITPQLETVALDKFLSELVESIRPIANQKGLEVRTHLTPGTVETDPGLLRSVMQNFLTNAVRYTESGGILVGMRRRGDTWRIDVVDTGIGIEQHQINSIFNEFTRLGQVDVEGLGLGLALVERLARLLDGRVEVSSRPDHGSRFSLVLTGKRTPKRIATDSHAATTGTWAVYRPLHVLVVDDDDRIVEATVAMLTSRGHNAIGASDIATALDLCGTVDAILADYRLNDGEDGITLIQAVRQRRPALPALLITAEATPELSARAMAQNIGVQAKPAAPDAIDRFLAEVSMAQIEAE